MKPHYKSVIFADWKHTNPLKPPKLEPIQYLCTKHSSGQLRWACHPISKPKLLKTSISSAEVLVLIIHLNKYVQNTCTAYKIGFSLMASQKVYLMIT